MRARPRLPAALLGVAAALAPLPQPGHAQAPELERGLYEITVTGTQQRATTRVLLDGTRVLLPLHEVLLQTGIPSARTGDLWQFQWPPPSYDAELNTTSGSFRSGAGRGVLPTGSWVVDDDVLHLDSLALHVLFGVQLRNQPAQLHAALSHADDFPVQRLLLEQQRRQVRLREPGRRAGGGHVPYPGTTGGLALNWDASALVREDRSYGVARGVLGASILGGALEVGGSTGLGTDLSGSDPIARFVRPFPTNPWLQQLSLGSLVSPTPVPRSLEGVYLSNAPFIPPTDFQEIAYRPTLPPGWTAEVYEGETLLGVVDAQDLESVDLPLGYGYTPVRVRMVGPAGQERTEQLQYIVPASRLPNRRTEYNLGFGRCRAGACDQYGFADLSRGLTPWLTLGAGAGYLREGDSSRVRPYATLSLNPLTNLAFDAQAEGSSHVRAAVQYLGRRNQAVSASLSWFNPRDASLALAGTYANLSTSLYLLDRYVTTSGQIRIEPGGRIGDGQLFTGVPLGRGYIGAQWHRSRFSPDLLGLRGFWRTRPLPAVRREINLGASASFARSHFELAEVTASLQPQRTATLNAALQWRPESGTTSFNLSYTLRTGVGVAQARSVINDRDRHLLVGMSGGVAAAPGSAAASYSGAVGRAGLAGTVFLDANGNGRFDPGEEPVADVPIMADGRRVVTGAEGRFDVWDLNAVRTLRLWVDSLGIPDTRVTPARPEYLLRLPANTFTRIEIPLVRTQEVMGSLQLDGRSALGGIAIELRGQGGAVVLQARSFSDGEYYFPRVAPGRYQVAVADASLAALDANADSFELDLAAQSRAPVRIPVLVLRPRRAPSTDSIQASENRTVGPSKPAPADVSAGGGTPGRPSPSGKATVGPGGRGESNDCGANSSSGDCEGNGSRLPAEVSARAAGPRASQLMAGVFNAPRQHSSWSGLAVLDRILANAARRAARERLGERLGYGRCISIDRYSFDCEWREGEIVRRGMGGADAWSYAREFALDSRRRSLFPQIG